MDDRSAPRGQMELRLEACQGAGFTDLTVEPSSTVTARWDSSADSFYAFTVSPGSDRKPVFEWREVTVGYFKMETYPNTIETFRSENEGPPRGLAELVAMDHTDRPYRVLWREAAAALLGIYELAALDISDSAQEAADKASQAASERLTERFQKPAGAPPLLFVDDYFDAFENACRQRAPYCDAILMGWDQEFEGLPEVEFGIAVNTPGQVLYKADPDGGLYLNGIWSAEHRLEVDLLEQFPDDAWARLGARNAARDLLAIQRTGHELMDAQKQETLQDLDRREAESLLDSMVRGTPVDTDGYRSILRGVEIACDALWERIKTHLIGIRSKPPVPPEEYDFIL